MGYVAIERHIGEKCEIARHRNSRTKTKSRYEFLPTYPGRMHVTGDRSKSDQHIHAGITGIITGSRTVSRTAGIS